MTSRLVIGTPRIPAKPPRRIPCTEARLVGSNILRDPGFDNHLSATGGGPNGDEIPYDGISLPGEVRARWSDDSASPSSSGWMADLDELAGSRWKISTANPRTGTKHARYGPNMVAGTALWPVAVDICAWPEGDFGRATSKVFPGDLVSLSFYWMASSISGSPTIMWGIQWLDAAGNYISQVDATSSVSTSYVQYGPTSAAAPSTAVFVLPFISRLSDSNSAAVHDVDDCVVGLA